MRKYKLCGKYRDILVIYFHDISYCKIFNTAQPYLERDSINVEWTYGSAQQTAFEILKAAVSKALMLCYYTLFSNIC